MYRFWSFFIRKQRFSFLLIIALLGFGIFSILSIPKESTPEVQIPVGIVTTILPGGSAEDVEKLLTDPIEEGLANNLEELNNITSTSREGVSSIVVEFEADAELSKSLDELREEVNRVKPELPDEAEEPIVSEINFVDQPILTLAVSGDRPAAQFTKLAEVLEDEINAVSGVSRVGVSGLRKREVQVVVDKAALERFGVRLTDVVGAIRATNTALPIGSIELDGVVYNVEFKGDIENPSEIANIAILNSAGEPVFVRDVAFVSDGLEDVTTFSRVSVNGELSQPALSFNVFKRSGGNISVITQSVRERLEELGEPGELLDGLTVSVVLDSGELLLDDLSNLVRTGMQTAVLVVIILFIAIGWREALIAGTAIPLSFLIAFIGLNASGNTLNFVSLFSLILAIGILVDSAIVMVEGIHTNLKNWMDKRESALRAIATYHSPLTSGTLTTVAVFAPLFLVSGLTGEFISSIPFTIIFVLFASLLVALGLVPLVASIAMRRRTVSKIELLQEKYAKKLQGWYREKIHSIVGNKKRELLFFASIIAALVLVLTFPFIGVVKVIFFAQSDVDWLIIDVEMPQGTVLGETDLELRRAEELLVEIPEIDSYIATVGQSSPFSDADGGTNDTKFGNIFINLDKERKRTSSDILTKLREKTSTIHTAEVRASQPSDGPPTGAPIVIKFLGSELEEIERVALSAASVLREISGTVDVVTSARDAGTEFVVSIDKAKATELGLDSNLVAQTLRTAVHGTEATSIQRGGEDIDIVVKLNLNPDYTTPHDTDRTTIDALRQIPVTTPQGSILLGSVLSTSIERSNALIRHEDRKRLATISSDVTPTGNTREIVTEFTAQMKQHELPEGVEMVIGGENEDVEQSFRDMFKALAVGMVLMLSILVLQFNSFRHALYVLAIVPFSLIGIFLGLAITDNALSFPSIMGFIALSGIVVNNSIILIDVINSKRREMTEEVSIAEVVIEGAVQRLRPILLTTLTTVIGVIPLIFASELWAPIAYSLMFGLAFSVVITLILVPVIYSRWPGKLPEESSPQVVPSGSPE